MDNTETYIKMCDCPEIQGMWEYNYGDWYFRMYYGTSKWRRIYVNQCIGGLSGGERIERKSLWLPRQDQLQEMVLKYWWEDEQPGNNISVMLQKFDWWLNDTCPNNPSMEQLWLAFVMKELYQKLWTGTGWQ